MGFVLSANLHRRHLNESQRSMVAARIANLQHGQHVTQDTPSGVSDNVVPITQKIAAEMLNVGTRSVQRARMIQDSTDPDLSHQVDLGEITVTEAARKLAPEKPRSHQKKRQGRTQAQERAVYWRDLKQALVNINGMPDVEHIAGTVPASQRAMVTTHLPFVADWLEDFRAEWAIRQAGTGDHDAAAIELRAITRAWDRTSVDARRQFAVKLKTDGWV